MNQINDVKLMSKFALQELPIDILTIIFQYTPAECIILRNMSKSLCKGVSKTGYSIYLMNLFYMNRYGFEMNTRQDLGINIRESDDIFWRYTDEVCCFMYKCGEPIKHVYMRGRCKYTKLCLKNNDLKSALMMLVKVREYDDNNDVHDDKHAHRMLGKYMITSGIKPYTVSKHEPFIKIVAKIAIRRGLKDNEIPVVMERCTYHYVYEALKVDNYNLADMVMDRLPNSFTDIFKIFIKKDDAELLEIFMKRYNKNIDFDCGTYLDSDSDEDYDLESSLNPSVLDCVYHYDSVEVFKYLCKNDKYLSMVHNKHITNEIIQKISKYIVSNNMDVVFDFEKSYLNKNARWQELYIPDSKSFKAACVLEQFYHKVNLNLDLEKLFNRHEYNIIDGYDATIITPHHYPFINKFLCDWYNLIQIYIKF